jgi:NitT/TauT family transport system permease protein
VSREGSHSVAAAPGPRLAVPGQRRRVRVPSGIRRACLGAVGIAAFFGAVQFVLWAGGVNQAVYPLPSTVLDAAVDMLRDGSFWTAIASTLTNWAEGLAIAVGFGAVAGLVLGALPWAEHAVRPLIEFLRPIPSVILLPLVLLAVQDSHGTEVVLVAFAALWPVLINTVYGIGEVDPLAVQTLRSFGFGPVAVAWRVSLPSAAPFIVTGVRIAASVSFVVAVAVELIGSGMNGIGNYLVQEESGTASVVPLLAVAVLSGVIGLLLNAVLAGADRRVFRWHYLQTATAGSA